MVELNVAAPIFVPSFVIAPTPTSIDALSSDKKKERQQHHRQRKNNRRNAKKPTRETKKKQSIKTNLLEEEPTWIAKNDYEERKGKGEFFFPTLATTTNSHDPIVVDESLSSHWAHVAQQGHEAEAKRRAEQEQLLKDKAAARNLTILTKRSIVVVEDSSIFSSPTGATDAATTSTEDELEMLVRPQNEQQNDHPTIAKNTKPWDMGKLRDRWWDLLAEKRMNDLIRHDEEQDETDTKCSETSAQSLVDLVPYHPHKEIKFNCTQPSNSKSLIPESYHESDYPLHKAVMDGDEVALRGLLALKQEEQSISRNQLGLDTSRLLRSIDDDTLSPIQLAVFLDRSRLLQLLLTETTSTTKDPNSRNPLLLAAELGHESCIQVLTTTTYISGKDNRNGNSALHYACQAGVTAVTVRGLLLQNTKLLTWKNSDDETPLHVACKYGHAHLVESMLNIATASMRNKVTRMQDIHQQTPLLAAVRAEAPDAVMTLLRWKGNGRRTYSSGLDPVDDDEPCPLLWAVSLGSMEMIHLLLEFSDSSLFRLNDALYAAVRSTEDFRDDMIRIMVEAGANPCRATTRSNHTALSLGATRGDPNALRVLMDSYKVYQMQSQQSRRQDPQLSNQGDFYFRAIEARETSEFQTAMTDSLVKALFLGWMTDDVGCLECAVLLFQKGANLHETGVARLKQSMKAKKLTTAMEGSADDDVYIFETTYVQPGPPGATNLNLSVYNRSALRFWSDALMHLDWMKAQTEGIQCSWILSENRFTRETDLALLKSLETVVVIAEGQRFLAHSQILAQKSGKLAAAIRFANMNHTDDSNPVEIEIGVSAKICQWLLQHIYHGSIASGWDPDPCDSVLELALVAEEFLCPSLLLECEMRLLASNATACYCWSCCVAVRRVDQDSERCQMAQCLYRARGPSQMLTAHTSMNALAVCQQLSSAVNIEDNHRIKFWPKPQYPLTYQSTKKAWVNFDSSVRILNAPFAAVQDAAIGAMLLHYPRVLKSESFLGHVRSMVDENPVEESVIHQEHEAQIMLLQMCLDEIAKSIMMKIDGTGSQRLESEVKR